jgi:3-oxoacyl-[acyl-carrier protein] reductase
MSENTDQKIALVTGASRGIGFAVAQSLVEQGFFVIGSASNEKNAKKLQADFETKSMNAKAIALDVTKPSAAKETLNFIKTSYGQAPTILVNNAGIREDNLLVRMSDDQWHRVMQTNLHGVFSLMKVFIAPMMKQRSGRIVNISSVVATSGNPGQANYVASKSGLEGLTKVAALEYARYGITVNGVAPGFIQTDMTATLAQTRKTEIESQIPMKRMGSVQEVASIVTYLCGNMAAYITGEIININGGIYMN